MSEGAMSKGAMRDPAWPAVVCWHTTDMSLSAHTMPTCLLGAVLGHLLPVNNPALGITGLVCCSGGSLALRWVAARVELQAHTGRQARRYCHQPRRPPRRCRCCSTASCFAEAAAARQAALQLLQSPQRLHLVLQQRLPGGGRGTPQQGCQRPASPHRKCQRTIKGSEETDNVCSRAVPVGKLGCAARLGLSAILDTLD